MKSYITTTNIGTRKVHETRAYTYANGKNFLGLETPKSIGNATFSNGNHKGYAIIAQGEIIGYSDSLESIDALLIREAHHRGMSNTGSRQIITPRGGLVITCPNAKKSISKTVRDSFEPTSRDYSTLVKIQPSTKLPENWKSMSKAQRKAWHAANKGA